MAWSDYLNQSLGYMKGLWHDAESGVLPQKGTNGAAHVLISSGTANIGGITGTGIMVGALSDVNAAVVADVDAAVAAATGLRLVGFACKESAAAAAVATFNIVHGATAAGGTLVVPVELAANTSAGEWFGPEGIAVPNGISIDWVAGQIDLVLFYKAVP